MSIDRSVDTLAARKAGLPKTTGSLAPMPGRCGAQLKYTGTSPENPPKYCMSYPMKGKRRCRLDGGKTPIGFDMPLTKTGLHSRYAYLSPKVFEAFSATLADAQLLDLKPDVAMLDLLAWQAAANISAAPGCKQWREVTEAIAELERAHTRPAVRAAMAKLKQAGRDGYDAAAARDETSKLFERRAKVVKTYQQLQVETQDLIPAKRVGLVMAMMAALVREFVGAPCSKCGYVDSDQRPRFAQRFVGLLGPRLRGDTTTAPSAGPVDAADEPA